MTEQRIRRVALVTNIPAPYRIPVYNLIGLETGIDLHLVFCSAREPNREWNLPALDRPHHYLKESFVNFQGSYIHFNLDVVRCLREIGPDVVVTTGFNPTHLLAFAYALRRGCAHIPMTDGTVLSERKLSWLHRLIRRFVFRRSQAFVAAARAGLDIYRTYGCPEDSLFRSALCVDNAAFARHAGAAKRYDLMFCGRIAAVKNPLFALQVAQATSRLIGRSVSICFVGSGPLEEAVRSSAAALSEIEVTFRGFAAQEELPRRYGECRVLLLPSVWDPWGVVANEACAAGIPVIASPFAGASGELVRDAISGFVRPLDVDAWAEAAAQLLQDPDLYRRMSEAARSLAASDFSFDGAARGLVAAIRHAAAHGCRAP
jgi:glycosyltransferase involved in cell wall biosynthesis